LNPSITIANRDSYNAERFAGSAISGDGEEVLRWCPHWCVRSSGILELAANLGFFKVQGAKANRAARFIAVEPHAIASSICRENLRISDVTAVTVMETAAATPVDLPTVRLCLPGDRDQYPDAQAEQLLRRARGFSNIPWDRYVSLQLAAMPTPVAQTHSTTEPKYLPRQTAGASTP